jgi:hypothetical protein
LWYFAAQFGRLCSDCQNELLADLTGQPSPFPGMESPPATQLTPVALGEQYRGLDMYGRINVNDDQMQVFMRGGKRLLNEKTVRAMRLFAERGPVVIWSHNPEVDWSMCNEVEFAAK